VARNGRRQDRFTLLVPQSLNAIELFINLTIDFLLMIVVVCETALDLAKA
jgi:hypothetical protein